MKIIQINCTYGSADSTGRSVKECHHWLLDNGHQSSCYVTRINDASFDSGVYFFSSYLDMCIHGFLSRLFGRQGLFSIFSTLSLLKKLDIDNPDVIILRVLHSNCINFPMLFKYLARKDIATVLVLDDSWYYTGHCCCYTGVKCNKWIEDCGKCPQLHQWNKSWLFDFTRQSLHEKKDWYSGINRLAVIGVSDWITHEAEQSILKDARIIRRIYNWIDQKTFKPQEASSLRKRLCISKDTKVLLGVASKWTINKGLADMLFVAENLTSAKIVMVGDMPNDVNVPANMLCVGTVKNPKSLAQYYSMADCYLNPSLQETFGKTTAEALSCGTPVIVYNTTACPELIGKGCGEIVQIGNNVSFLNKVRNVIDNPELYTNCRSWAIRMFDKDENIKQYMTLFEELTSYH